MAQQVVKKNVSMAGSVPLRTPAPRVGKVKTGDWDYARFRITINDPDAFMDYMRHYPTTEGVTLFLYRLLPPIDLSLIGLKESNIQKGGYADLGLFSLEAVAEKFGRGKYNVKVTDSNRPEGQREVVKSCQYKINDAEKPPVYDIRTLQLGHPDAIDEVNRLMAAGTLVRDASGAPRLRTAADAPGPAAVAAPAAAGSGDLLTRDVLGSVLVSLINRGTASPHESVKDTIEVARLLMPAAQPAVDLEALVERVVSRLGPKNGAGREDAFATYERIDGFLTRFGGKPASGEAAVVARDDGGARSWMPHLPAVFSEARMLIPEITGMLRELRAERAAAAGQPQGGQQMQRQQQQQPKTLEERIEEIFRLGFAQMQTGLTGFDFAAFICGFHPGGLEVYRFLEPQGAAGLIALAAMNPRARALVNDPQIRPQLEVFLKDFFSFDPSPEAESEDDPETPA